MEKVQFLTSLVWREGTISREKNLLHILRWRRLLAFCYEKIAANY